MIPSIAYYYTSHFLKSPFPHYSLYYQPIITLIGLIIGFFVAITMFYLGKFHDYSNEQIRYSSKLIECIDKLKIRVKLTADDSKKDEIAKFNEHYKSIREVDKSYFNLPRSTILPFLIYIVLFASYYYDSIKYSQNPIFGNFVYLLILIGFGTALFLISWFRYEQQLSSIKSTFQTMSDLTLKIKAILYELELKDKIQPSAETPNLNTEKNS
jgi:hypothetical protein